MIKIMIVGITHIDTKSHKKVVNFLNTKKPEAVCLEIDEYRLAILLENEDISDDDLFTNSTLNTVDGREIFNDLKTKGSVEEELSYEFPSLIEDIGFFENYLANIIQTEQPGKEMLLAYTIAKKNNAAIYLIDRSLNELSSAMEEELSSEEASKFQELIDELLFDKTITAKPLENTQEEISEEDSKKINLDELDNNEEINLNEVIEVFKDEDSLANIMNIFKGNFPKLYSILLEDRNDYMIRKIHEIAPNHKEIAVIVGFGHVTEIAKGLRELDDKYEIEIIK